MWTRELLAVAEAVVGDAERVFRSSIGAEPMITKGAGDFATETDMEIEQRVRETLAERTGLPVFGEEGGGSLDEDTVWVVDPVDGTSNFSAGNPMCSTIVSLLHYGTPVVGVISLPMLGKRLTAVHGSPLYVNGVAQKPLEESSPLVAQVGFGSIVSAVDSRFPTMRRQALMRMLADLYPRLRVTGSVGVDLAFTALGTFGGSISFSPHVWDNAAGVLLVRSAGGVVTDLDGNTWGPRSHGVIAGTPLVHHALMSTIEQSG